MFRKKPFALEDVTLHLDEYFKLLHNDDENRVDFEVMARSTRIPLDYHYATSKKNVPFHISGISKMFTATLVSLLVERGSLKWKSPISDYFTPLELSSLFVVNGIDHSMKVTVEHLLGHTSGIADYFEGKVTSGIPFREAVTTDTDAFWTPEMLLNFTRNRQTAVGKPDEKFSYSDTGYVLLGYLIEKVTRKSLGENLRSEIFLPLGMDDSYLMFYTEPQKGPKVPIGPAFFDGIDLSTLQSLSYDWAGGGIVSTMEDLLKFYMALRTEKLIRNETLHFLENCTNKFKSGIYCGLGMMEIHFEDFLVLLKDLPRVTGHFGVTSTQLFYDAENDAYIILNFSSSKNMTKSFRALIEIENTLRKWKKANKK